jgi:long-chain fatty acid transport protein
MRGIVKAAYALGVSAALLTPAAANATGYAIREQSGSMLGQAFAGQNAYSNDPSIIFFNPAGMSALDGTRASAAVSYIHPKNEFDDDGSTAPILLGTDDGGDAGQDAVVPAFYGMTSLGAFRLGIGVNAPFGLSTEYNDGWIGRYAALDSRLLTINVNPVVSYQVLNWLAIGAGAQIEKADARLTNAAFFGLALGDGDVELQADDDVAFGFTAGALITPRPGTEIGIGFRSSIHHDLDGKAQIHVPVLGTTNMNASAELDTPESLGISIHQRVTDRLSLVGTVEWTNWSRFDELRVKFDTPGVPDSVTNEHWEDSYFFALGANYQLTDKLLLRSGVAYDQTPVQDNFRTARLPDEDRYWLALGATYAFNNSISVDVGYTHIFIRDSSIDETFHPIPGNPAAGTLRGDYQNSVDILAVQANFKF